MTEKQHKNMRRLNASCPFVNVDTLKVMLDSTIFNVILCVYLFFIHENAPLVKSNGFGCSPFLFFDSTNITCL